jgi:hypothetical protein
MSDGGKGSTPRPLSVSQAEYSARWDLIFGKNIRRDEKDFDLVLKNEYYDILTTEDCFFDDDEKT